MNLTNDEEFGENLKREIEKQNLEVLDFFSANTTWSIPTEKEGIKESEDKIDYSELDWEYIDSMAIRMAENTKYPPENWKKPMNIKELAKSAIRHARKILQPLEGDIETDLEHAEALGCNGMMINYQIKRYNDGKR
jgi:hypothetical protein